MTPSAWESRLRPEWLDRVLAAPGLYLIGDPSTPGVYALVCSHGGSMYGVKRGPHGEYVVDNNLAEDRWNEGAYVRQGPMAVQALWNKDTPV